MPITLVLRPFNFETFATTAYISASEDMLEAAAVPSLFLILIAAFFITITSNYILKEKSNSNVNLSSAVQTPAVSETELFGACRKMVLWRAIHNICMICLLKNRKIIFCCRLFALANNELANRFCSSQLSATLLQRW